MKVQQPSPLVEIFSPDNYYLQGSISEKVQQPSSTSSSSSPPRSPPSRKRTTSNLDFPSKYHPSGLDDDSDPNLSDEELNSAQETDDQIQHKMIDYFDSKID